MRKGRPAVSLLFSSRFRFHPSCRNSLAKAFGSPAKFVDATSKQYFLRPQQRWAHIAVSDHTDHTPTSNVRPTSSADNRRSQKTSSEPSHQCRPRRNCSAPFEHGGLSRRFREPKQNQSGSSSVQQASSTGMDQNQQWDRRRRGQREYIPPTSNGPNPFGMPFSMPPNFNPGWIQPSLQNHFSQPGQPRQQNDGRGWGSYAMFGLPGLPGPLPQGLHQQNDGRDQGHMPFGHQRNFSQGNQLRSQNDGRGRGQAQASQPTSWNNPFQASQPRQQDYGRRQGEGDFYRPQSQFAAPKTNQQNRQGGGQVSRRSDNQPSRRDEVQQNRRARRPPRAPAPTWDFGENPPLPFPMDSPATGPFRSTSPARRNTPGISWNGSKIKKKDRPPINRKDPRDPITAPSPASGGIPEPTAEYLLRASFMPYRLTIPKPMLVVIDLNGTLLFRPNKRQASAFVERPRARAFLERCIDKYHVVLWSSARPENVRRMCAQLLSPDYLARVIAVWGRDRFGLSQTDYARRTQCYKRLTRLWSDPIVAGSYPPLAMRSGSNPSLAGGADAPDSGEWTQANTVLIDDSAEKARSEPHNAVTLPEFAGNKKEKPEVLPLVEAYLETLSFQGDISTYIKENPFSMAQVPSPSRPPSRSPVAAKQESSGGSSRASTPPSA